MEIDWKATWRNAKIGLVGVFVGFNIGLNEGYQIKTEEFAKKNFASNKHDTQSIKKSTLMTDTITYNVKNQNKYTP